MHETLSDLARCILTPTGAKHRLFALCSRPTLPDHQLIAIARDDNTTFGILHSKFHELWSLRLGTSLEDRPRYTPTTCFETFPFPEGLTPNIPAAKYANDPRAIAISKAAARLKSCAKRGSTRLIWCSVCPKWCRAIPTAFCPSMQRPRKF